MSGVTSPIAVRSIGQDGRPQHSFVQDSNNGSGGRETVKNESTLDLGLSYWSG
jgi:hypothetical protein